MKRKITMVMPDGSKKIMEEMDEAPMLQKNEAQSRQPTPQDAYLNRIGQAGQRMPMARPRKPMRAQMAQMAQMGQNGDTELAHVNNYEAALLKALGGAGTRNPMTGLKQFYVDSYGQTIDPNSPFLKNISAPRPPTTVGSTRPFIEAPSPFRVEANQPFPMPTPPPGPAIDTSPKYGGGSFEAYDRWKMAKDAARASGAMTTAELMLPPRGYDEWKAAQGTAPSAPTIGYARTALASPTGTIASSPLSDGGDSFNLDPNLAPWSGSINNSTGNQFGFNTSQGTSSQDSINQSNQFALNNAANYAGLDESSRSALMGSITPQLISSVANMPGNLDTYTNEALGSYQTILRNTLKDQVPKVISALANRGILNSSEGQQILSDVISNTTSAAADKGYQTAMQAALLKANMPSILGQLADLGKYSTGTSTGISGGTSTGRSFGNAQNTAMGLDLGNQASSGWSYSTDPTVMYRTMADLIQSML